MATVNDLHKNPAKRADLDPLLQEGVNSARRPDRTNNEVPIDPSTDGMTEVNEKPRPPRWRK